MPEEVSADNHGMGQLIISERETGKSPDEPGTQIQDVQLRGIYIDEATAQDSGRILLVYDPQVQFRRDCSVNTTRIRAGVHQHIIHI